MYHLLLVTVLLNVVIKTEQQRPCRLSKPDSPQHTPNGCEWQYMKATNNNCGVGKYELTCAQDVDMSCFCKPDSGSCTGAAYFYHYDPSVDRCLPFSYSGCGGNTNRFQTEDECTHNCVSWNRETKQVDALCANVQCPQQSVCIGGLCVPRETMPISSGLCNGLQCPSGARCIRNTCVVNADRFLYSTTRIPDQPFFRCTLITCPRDTICVDNVGCVLTDELPSTERPVSWSWQSYGPSKYKPNIPINNQQIAWGSTPKPLFNWISWWKA